MVTVRNSQIYQQWHADSNMILLMSVIIVAITLYQWCQGECFPKHRGRQLRLMFLEGLDIRVLDGLQQICQTCPMALGDTSKHALGDAQKSVVSLADGTT